MLVYNSCNQVCDRFQDGWRSEAAHAAVKVYYTRAVHTAASCGIGTVSNAAATWYTAASCGIGIVCNAATRAVIAEPRGILVRKA